ncbi:MAG: molybdopterin-dependent oxidoreductase [Rhodospirillaceae bacterium]|jgi:anaerobic selenocysteine-containing dehydrogenase|nr:molybdopterin-dependent oxidoreductase [Rhodospirillaceae bacterium]MBT5190799.1 molybdopterin-dependent oxidoreductase [Rhodospirillaceae bacterium]MBT5896351.1 molybdopterin-dependent oxidoreductase [Rhodospirillaceae bacterium]
MAQQLASVCPLDCPDTCSLTVTVEDGKITKVRGSEANPLTKSAICSKVSKLYPDFVHGSNRLTQPLRRIGPKGEGKFEAISWDQAMDLIHEKFQDAIDKYGPETIMPLNYAGPHGMLAGGSMDLRFFHQLGATVLSRRPLCGGIKSEAWAGTFGAIAGVQMTDLEQSDMIVVWGNNVSYSNLHLAPVLQRLRDRGGKVVVVDPKRIKVAEQADLHLALRPGTDIVLAFALAAELERRGAFDTDFIARMVEGAEDFMAQARPFSIERAAEITGLAVDDILQLASWYHGADAAALAVGNGLERNRNGGAGIRAIFALPALTGKFQHPAAGLVGGSGNLFPKTMGKLARPDLIPEGTRTLNIIDVGRHLAEDDVEPPLRGLVIYNHNPLVVHPDQNTMRRGLAREDVFTVVIDIAKTDSADYADVVLPAASHFEHEEIFCAYGQQFLQRAERVIEPVGEALPNTEIFRRLARRFGFNDPIFQASDAELIDDAINADDPRLEGQKPSELPLATAISMSEPTDRIGFERTPTTKSGRIELKSAYLTDKFAAPIPLYVPLAEDQQAEPAHPFALITPSSNWRTNSTFGGLAKSDNTPPLEMHPDDAAQQGLSDGQQVRVYNDLGEVFLPLRITDSVARGVLLSYKGAWMKTTTNGQTVSALAPTTKADLSEGACYNDTRVAVAPV